jgi:hypothetical protein
MKKDKIIDSPINIVKRRYGVSHRDLMRDMQLEQARIVLLGLSALSTMGCTGYSRLDAKGVDVSLCASTSNEDQCDKDQPLNAESEDTEPQG